MRKWGDFKTVHLAGAMLFSRLLLMAAFPLLPVACLGCVLTGLGTAAVVPICYSIVGKRGQGSLPVALSMVNGISFIGFLLMPAAVGGISQFWGLRIAFAMTGLVCVLTNGMMILIERQAA